MLEGLGVETPGDTVGLGGHHDDPCGGRRLRPVEDQVGQQEGPEIVGCDHVVEAIWCEPGPQVLDSCVVHQDIDDRIARADLRCDPAHLFQPCEKFLFFFR